MIGGLCVGCITLEKLITYSSAAGAFKIRDAVPGRDEDPGGHKVGEFHKCPSHVRRCPLQNDLVSRLPTHNVITIKLMNTTPCFSVKCYFNIIILNAFNDISDIL